MPRDLQNIVQLRFNHRTLMVIFVYPLRILYWNNAKQMMTNKIIDENTVDALIGQFNSHLYDDSTKYISTITSHIIYDITFWSATI